MAHKFPQQRDPGFEDSAQLELLGSGKDQMVSIGKFVVLAGEGIKTITETCDCSLRGAQSFQGHDICVPAIPMTSSVALESHTKTSIGWELSFERRIQISRSLRQSWFPTRSTGRQRKTHLRSFLFEDWGQSLDVGCCKRRVLCGRATLVRVQRQRAPLPTNILRYSNGVELCAGRRGREVSPVFYVRRLLW